MLLNGLLLDRLLIAAEKVCITAKCAQHLAQPHLHQLHGRCSTVWRMHSAQLATMLGTPQVTDLHPYH